jgi:NAD(P)H-hydrate epimerase
MKAVTTEQIRALDRRAMEAGTPGKVLMDRAGQAVARKAAALSRKVLLLAGKGNNGGDAIVAARHLAAMGCEPTLALFCRRSELSGDPLAHFQELGNVPVLEFPNLDQLSAEVIVDGLLGTGLAGDVREPVASAIRWINKQLSKVIAIDLPSGLDSDTGEVHGVCVRANVTVAMGLPKIGLLRPTATDWVGAIEVADIGFPPEFVAEIPSDVELLTAADVRPLLPPRRRTTHKGDYGHLLVIAGSEGYTGAPVLCAHAAARSGVGLVTLAVPRDVYPIVAANCPPEVMPRPLDRLGALADYDAVALGPGLGQAMETQRSVLDWISSCPRPLVVDADGLNALARNISLLNTVNVPLVLTPHPGEMARLCNKSVREVQAHRWEVARQFARAHRAVLALKGAGTIVTDSSNRLWVNLTGNPGMAKGGIGDALTGIIGALLAQGLPALDAARAGVFVHGVAGDIACERCGERSMQASDLIANLGAAFNVRQQDRTVV